MRVSTGTKREDIGWHPFHYKSFCYWVFREAASEGSAGGELFRHKSTGGSVAEDVGSFGVRWPQTDVVSQGGTASA